MHALAHKLSPRDRVHAFGGSLSVLPYQVLVEDWIVCGTQEAQQLAKGVLMKLWYLAAVFAAVSLSGCEDQHSEPKQRDHSLSRAVTLTESALRSTSRIIKSVQLKAVSGAECKRLMKAEVPALRKAVTAVRKVTARTGRRVERRRAYKSAMGLDSALNDLSAADFNTHQEGGPQGGGHRLSPRVLRYLNRLKRGEPTSQLRYLSEVMEILANIVGGCDRQNRSQPSNVGAE